MENACNIGSKGIRRRMWLGLALITVGVVASFLDRSFLGQVVAFFGFLSFFQAQEGTCVGLAARGARETDEGKVLIEDPALAEHFQRRSRKIYLKSFAATLGVLLAGRAWLYLID